MSDALTLIVGTTGDYIEAIQRRLPGYVFFLTDTRERERTKEEPPPCGFELLCDLASPVETIECLKAHMQKSGMKFNGVACFDCESMYLASVIAKELDLDYPSPDVVSVCRDKFASKERWRKASLPCPCAWRAKDIDEARELEPEMKYPVVVKPLSGSGSEYVFKCSDRAEYLVGLGIIESGLSGLRANPCKPLYSRDRISSALPFACAIEEFIEGQEYSCDFVIDGDRLEVIRIASKITEPDGAFGTTLAYIVPCVLPNLEVFRSQLQEAARSVGIKRAVCMLDFIVRDGKAVMIEIAPRPGGDCLPALIRQSSQFDILEFTVRFSAGEFPVVPSAVEWKQLVGLRLLASKDMTVSKIDTTMLENDARVLEYSLRYESGHKVVMPPEDYDSRVLGHVVFSPSCMDNIEQECKEISRLLEIEEAF